MVYHCTLPTEGCGSVCDCPLLPLRLGTGDQLDAVDEALAFFRANVLFRSFDIASSADKLLLYLTLYISHILQRLVETQASRAQAERLVFALAHENFRLPGEPGFPLGGLFSPPQSREQEETIRAYLQQCREWAGRRLIDKCYMADGSLSKFWAAFACRRFLNKSMA